MGPRDALKKDKLWREGDRFVKKIIAREQRGQGEFLTLACGHTMRVPLADSATAIRCRFCIREEITGYNPPDDPTPAKVSVKIP